MILANLILDSTNVSTPFLLFKKHTKAIILCLSVYYPISGLLHLSALA